MEYPTKKAVSTPATARHHALYKGGEVEMANPLEEFYRLHQKYKYCGMFEVSHLAQTLGVSETTIYRWIRGETKVLAWGSAGRWG